MSDTFMALKHEKSSTATSTLFVAFKRNSEICAAKDAVSAISGLFKKTTSPISVRPHYHKETNAFKGTCHVNFSSSELASSAIQYLKEHSNDVNVAEHAPDILRKGPQARDQFQTRQMSETRFAMAQLALDAFANKSQNQDLPHAAGLLLVGSTVRTACKLTPSLQAFTDTAALAQQERAAARGGNTCLLAGLREAAQQLYTYRDWHKKCKLRILVLTDGEDTSDDDPLKELGTLREAKIVVDVVVLGGAQAGDLAAIAGYTGGLVLQPLTNDDLLNTFEAEALMQLLKRKHLALPALPNLDDFRRASKKEGIKLSKQRRQHCDEQSATMDSCGKMALVARGMLSEASGGAQSSAAVVAAMTGTTNALSKPVTTPTHAMLQDAANKALRGIGVTPHPSGGVSSNNNRIKRLMMEAKKCMYVTETERELHTQLEIFIGDNLSEWQAILKGPDDPQSPYCGGTWRLMIRFLDDYPNRAPDVYFVTPILHLNVDKQGKVCHSALDREYMPSAPITHLLACIVSLLIAPDPQHPFNSALAQVYWESVKQYEGFGEAVDWIHETEYFKLVRKEVRQKASASFYELVADMETGTAGGRVRGEGRENWGDGAVAARNVRRGQRGHGPGLDADAEFAASSVPDLSSLLPWLPRE